MKHPSSKFYIYLFFLVAILSYLATDSIPRNPDSVSTNAATIANKELGARLAAHEPAAPVNTDSLKTSDWYQTVIAGIARKNYYIAAESNSRASSINPGQAMKAIFAADGFTLSNLEESAQNVQADMHQHKNKKVAHWQLPLKLKGLYADGALVCKPDSDAIMRTDSNELNYTHHDLLQVQYQNTEAGLRQNFIIKKAPATDANELRISMCAGNKWIVNKANDKEIHFAQQSQKHGLKTKVIYKDLKVWDAGGRELEARMETNNHEISIVVNAQEAQYPVTIDPLSTTASTTLTGPLVNSTFGYSVASAGDVNKDGYSDVIVGAPFVSSITGTAYIYHGSSTGLATTISATLTGFTTNSNFGSCVASAGDVNGDGYSDVIVGAYAINSSTGAAYIYQGSASGISATPSTTLNGPGVNSAFGLSVSTAGDVDGDGYSDVIVGAHRDFSNLGAIYIYRGGSSGIGSSPFVRLGLSSNGHFGISVASADVNGDGYSDVIVGAYAVSSFTGAAYIYHGSAGGPAVTPTTTLSGPAGGFYGASVASAGDVNGDGYNDVIIGAPRVNTFTGEAHLYHGSSSGISTVAATILSGTTTNSNFGGSVASAGDVDGDGYSDIIIGAYITSSNTGAAYFYQGSASGVTVTPASTFNGTVDSKFGKTVAAAGDVNGDGYSDVIIGAENAIANFGAAYIYEGAPAGINNTSQTTVNWTASSIAELSIANAGDVNGDGYNDVILGTTSGPPPSYGAAYIMHGSASGLSPFATTVISCPVLSNIGFASSIATAGDVNGDGYNDVIIGAPNYSSNTGIAYVYLGSASGISSAVDKTLTGFSNNSHFGWSVASAGDINSDGYGDVIIGAYGEFFNRGAAYIYHGSASGTSTAAATTLAGSAVNDYFGFSVSSTGNVNGDSYSDIIVGARLAPGGSGNGRVYIYNGSSSGISSTASAILSGPAGILNFGHCVAPAGDVNGDGYSDIILGAPAYSSFRGEAFIYYGASSGINPANSTTIIGPVAGGYFGGNVSSAGDVNGDGYSDVIVGADNASPTGNAYIYHGGETGISTTAATTLTGPVSNQGFGQFVAGPGDVNGDGCSDPAIAAYNTATSKATIHVYPGNNGYNKRNHTLRLYETNLTTPIKRTNINAAQFGVGVFVRPFAGAIKARLVWETQPNGTGFLHNSPITNYAGYTAAQPTFTFIPPAGLELKTLITKNGGATKFRVRVQYQSTLLPGGQVFGPWIYPQNYLTTGQSLIFFNATLPVKFGNITAYEKQSGVQIDWTVHEEQNLSHYVVEHSANGISFLSIGTVAAQNTGNQTSYGFFDAHPFAGINFYRIRSVDFDGKTGYSHIVKVNLDKTDQQITLYPNPVRNGFISIQSSDLVKGRYTANIFNAAGQLTYTRRFHHAGGAINQTFNLPANLNTGMYMFSLENETTKIFDRTVIIN